MKIVLLMDNPIIPTGYASTCRLTAYELIKKGHRMRIYVPYGEAWYSYSVRRLRESPQIAGHVFRAMLGLR